ncbi:MAG: theD1 [Candidatus Saccharibacteria bacterium]|jgi:PadR family transcriptional regulator PadR|nr:theD1 [Candidatus Saccharibacteria bacterium]
MSSRSIDEMVADWDEVYKKGQLSLWVLLAVFDGKKYAAQITDFMSDATDGVFEVKEQSLYRALRRFDDMGLVRMSLEESPNSGPKRKYYQLTEKGEEVVGRFVALNIAPLLKPSIIQLLQSVQTKGEQHD